MDLEMVNWNEKGKLMQMEKVTLKVIWKDYHLFQLMDLESERVKHLVKYYLKVNE
jgi:hypothetical protein